jgi:cysteate synthase
LYDALKDSDGDVLLATNEEARNAAQLFLEKEGIDIHPAAAVATATLINAAKKGDVEKEALIMLNITGGGEEKFKKENKIYYLHPEIIFDINPNEDEVKEKVAALFK